MERVKSIILIMVWFLYPFWVFSEKFREEPLPISEQDFKVVYFAPKGTLIPEQVLEKKVEILIMFNQPIRSITPRNKQNHYIPFRILPELKGKIIWYGTKTVAFRIEKGLKPGQKYWVTIPKEIRSIYGKKLKQNFRFSFRVPDFRIVYSEPPENSILDFKDFITVEWNYPVEFHKKNDIRIIAKNRVLKFNQDYQLENYYGKLLDIQFIRPLPVQTDVKIIFSKNIKIRGTDFILGKDVIFQYKTKGPIQVSFRDKATFFDDWYKMGISFSNLVFHKEAVSKILVLDGKTGKSVEYLGKKNHRKIRYLSLREWKVQPNHSYAVVVKKGLQDIYGSSLKQSISYRFNLPSRKPKIYYHSGSYYSEACGVPYQPFYYSNIKKVKLSVRKFGLRGFYKGTSKGPVVSRREIPITKFLNQEGYHFIEFKDLLKKQNQCYYGWLEIFLQPSIYNEILDLFSESKIKKQIKNSRIFEQQIQFTDIGLTVRESPYRMWIWAQSLSKGNGISNVSVRFYEPKSGRFISRCNTNQQGFCEIITNNKNISTNRKRNIWFPGRKKQDRSGYIIFAQKSIDKVAMHIDPYYDMNLYYRSEFSGNPLLKGFVVFDRKLYKPGERVFFKVFVHYLYKGKIIKIKKGEATFRVRITNPRGKEIYNRILEPGLKGGLYDSIQLDSNAVTGHYQVRIEQEKFFKQNRYLKGSIWSSFQVEDFRALTFTVVVPKIPYHIYHTPLYFPIEGKYLFGAPMSGSKLEVVAYYTKSSQELKDHYKINLLERNRDDDIGFQYLLKRKIGKLDPSGKYAFLIKNFDIPSDTFKYILKMDKKNIKKVKSLEWKTLSLKSISKIDIVTKVYDLAGRYVTKSVQFNSYPSLIIPAIRSREKVLKQGENFVFSVANFNVKTRDWESSKQKITVYIFKEEWYKIYTKSSESSLSKNEVYTPVLVFQKTYSIEGKKQITFRPEESGSYIVIVRNSRQAYTRENFYVAGKNFAFWKDDDVIKMIPDKEKYEIGDTAKILIQSPFKDARAIITVEQEDLYKQVIIDHLPSSYLYQLKIKPEYIPGIHVSVMIFTHREKFYDFYPNRKIDPGKPQIRIGSIYLDLSKTSKTFPVSVRSSCNPCKPGQWVTIHIQTLPDADVTISVADRSVLDLIGYSFPDAIEEIYTRRPYGISLFDIRERLLNQFLKKIVYQDHIYKKVGGGGDDFESEGGFSIDGDDGIRKNFRFTAYWNPSIQTDQKGIAKVRFLLPDNITTFRIMVIASKGDRYGQTRKEFQVQKEVMVLPVLPNFLRPDEKIKIGALIINNQEQKQKATFSLSSNPEICDFSPKRISFEIGAHQTKALFFPCRFSSKQIRPDSVFSKVFLGNVHFRFSTRTSEYHDKVERKVHVLNEIYQENFTTTGMVQKESSENIQIPNPRKNPGFFSISVYPSISLLFKNSLEYFSINPYLCLEQRTSAFLINYLVHKYGLSSLKEGIYTYQNSRKLFLEELTDFLGKDGGFKLWKNSVQSNTYITLYVLDILYFLNKEGEISIQEEPYASIIPGAIAYIKKKLRKPSQFTRFYYTETILYATYVLSLYDRKETKAIIDKVIELVVQEFQVLSFRAKGYLALLLYWYDKNPELREKLTREFLNSLRFTNRKIFLEESLPYYSSVETFYSKGSTVSVWLEYLMTIRYDREIINAILTGMLSRNPYYTSSFEEAHLAKSLNLYIKNYESFSKNNLKIYFNKIIKEKLSFKNANQKFQKSYSFSSFFPALKKIRFVNSNFNSNLYYIISLNYHLRWDQIRPVNRGFYIERKLYRYNPKKKDYVPVPLQNKKYVLENGKVYLIQLMVVNDKPISNFVIRDPISSLTEIVKVDFVTENQKVLQYLSEKIDNNDYFDFSFKEIYKDKYLILGDYLSAGSHEYYYLLRTISMGKGYWLPAYARALYEPEIYGRSESYQIIVK